MRILSDYRGPVALADVPRFSGAGGATRPPVQVSSPAGEGGEGGEASTYGPDALIRDGRGGQGDEAARAERRMLTLLQARDSQVRHDEESRGEAVGSRAYIYQAGPDGRQYAVGTAPHLVREGEEASGEFEAGGSANLGSATLPALLSGSGGGEDREFESRLQARDRLVRAHEHAHMAAGGQVGAARYDYQTGPDGRRYAVGGSVSVVMTSVPGDPEATRRSANAAERAAMAPGGPSGQDFTVAANARRLRARAAAEEQRLNEVDEAGEVSAQVNAGLTPGQERYLNRAMRAYARQAAAV